MLQYERWELLLQLLQKKKTATIRELAAALYVSEASVRRDIERLEGRGLVRKIYGGVMLADAVGGVIPVSIRDGDHSAAKEEIARRAAALISDGDTVIMDASSTVRRMVKHLRHLRGVTIITNNVKLLQDAVDSGISEHIRIYGSGGILLPEDHAFAGPAAEAFLRGINADLLFFSSLCLSDDGEISDPSEIETSLRRVMLERAHRRYFLCDASKFGTRAAFTLCHRDALTGILSDAPLPWEDNPKKP